MPRFHNIDGEIIQFTQAEEDAWDAEEKEWNDAAPARAWQALRTERNAKLAASDWTQMADSPLAADKKTEWATYRASLRDLPSATGFPHTMTWPTEPS